MKKIKMYTTKVCPYCVRAKALLQRKGYKYEEISVENESALEEMLKKSGGMRTVPQIFIGDTHVGGSDELHALERAGKLDEMMK